MKFELKFDLKLDVMYLLFKKVFEVRFEQGCCMMYYVSRTQMSVKKLHNFNKLCDFFLT